MPPSSRCIDMLELRSAGSGWKSEAGLFEFGDRKSEQSARDGHPPRKILPSRRTLSGPSSTRVSSWLWLSFVMIFCPSAKPTEELDSRHMRTDRTPSPRRVELAAYENRSYAFAHWDRVQRHASAVRVGRPAYEASLSRRDYLATLARHSMPGRDGRA